MSKSNISFQIILSEWLSENYKLFNNIIYSHLVDDGFDNEERFMSKTINSIFNKKEKLFNLTSEESNKVSAADIGKKRITKERIIKAKIGIELQKKRKQNTKFNLHDLQDFCLISGKTPNELLKVEGRPRFIATDIITVNTEDDINYIFDQHIELFKQNKTLNKTEIVCLSLPLLEINSVAIISMQKPSVDQITSFSSSAKPTIEYEIRKGVNKKTLHLTNYKEMDGAFNEYVLCELTSIKDDIILSEFSKADVNQYLNSTTQEEASEEIDISRPTLDEKLAM